MCVARPLRDFSMAETVHRPGSGRVLSAEGGTDGPKTDRITLSTAFPGGLLWGSQGAENPVGTNERESQSAVMDNIGILPSSSG